MSKIFCIFAQNLNVKIMEIVLGVLLAVSVAANVVMWFNRPKVVEISDVLPEKNSAKNRWMKLQNEGKNYVRTDNERVYLKVVK